jgi:uroporphyrinogen-III decarboxylase
MGGYFDAYIAPHLRRWTGWLRERGHRTMLHNDGTLRGTLEKLAAAGVACVDSVVPKPVGDVAIDDLRALAGNDILLLGGLPGAMFAPPFTARDVERQVREIIRVHKDSGTFMFGVADQVPPNGDLALVRLVSDLVEEYGRY